MFFTVYHGHQEGMSVEALPVNLASRFSRNEATPSRPSWSPTHCTLKENRKEWGIREGRKIYGELETVRSKQPVALPNSNSTH